MFESRPDRIPRGRHPDLALLDRLKTVQLGQADIPEHEFIQFRRLQSLVYGLRAAGHDVEAMQTEAFVGAALFAPQKCKVAVTSCEYDLEVNDDLIRRIGRGLRPDLVWLTTNANLAHPRVRAYPLGLADYCGQSPFHAVIGDSTAFKTVLDEVPRQDRGLVLMNFHDRTKPAVREPVRVLFRRWPFVTEEAYGQDAAAHRRYVESLRAHAFCLAPRGNGIDTHRIWESLYAGSIPIVQKSLAMREFADLPILFVDRWEQACDESLLRRTREEFLGRTWDLRKLTLSYWYGRVCELLGAPAP